VVCIVTMLAVEQQTNSGSNPDRPSDLSIFQRVQTDFETHPVSHSIGTEGTSPWSKATGA